MAKEPLLSQEEVASVLSGGEEVPAAKLEAGYERSNVYSLRRPVMIAEEDEPGARQRMARLSDTLATVFRRELEAEVRLEVEGFKQEQAAAAVGSLQQPVWIMAFVNPEGGGMALALDPSCALSLVELALGGAGNTSASGRAPTPLETRVMSKLCATLAGPLGAGCVTVFSRGAFVTDRLPRELAAPGETVCVGLLKITIADKRRRGLLLASPALLHDPDRASDEHDAVERVGPLAGRLERVQVAARPVLRAGAVALADLAHLEPGAVLSLEPSEHATLELRVTGDALLSGHVVRGEHGAEFRVVRRRGRPGIAKGPAAEGTGRDTKKEEQG